MLFFSQQDTQWHLSKCKTLIWHDLPHPHEGRSGNIKVVCTVKNVFTTPISPTKANIIVTRSLWQKSVVRITTKKTYVSWKGHFQLLIQYKNGNQLCCIPYRLHVCKQLISRYMGCNQCYLSHEKKLAHEHIEHLNNLYYGIAGTKLLLMIASYGSFMLQCPSRKHKQ